MAGGLQLGSLYVSLTARTSAFGKGMANAMKDLERFAKQAKAVSSEVAMVSGVLAAVGGAAVKMASSVDGPTKSAMNGLEKSTQLLAVQVADLLLPAVREMTKMFREAAAVVAGLDPEVKKQIATLAVLAVQVALGAKVFSMFWGAIAAGAAIMKGVTFAAFSSTILSIGLAIAMVIALVVLLHRAWRKNWGGIQGATSEVLNWLKDGFGQFASFMGTMWDFLVDGAAKFVNGLLDVVDTVQEVTGSKLIDTGSLREGFSGMFKDLKSGSFFSEAFKFGKSVGQQVADGLVEELGAIKKELGLDKLFKGGATIGLGRGMGSSPKQSDPSGMSFAADESMRTAALLAAGSLRDISAEAERFKKSLADVDFGQQVKKWMADIGRQPATSMGASGLASVSLSDPNLIASRRSSFTAPQAGLDEVAKAAKDKAAAAMTEAAAKWKAVGEIALKGVTGALGKVGDLINAAVQGAQSGGVWGAIIAVIMEVVKETKSAMEFVGTAMSFVKALATMIEPLVKPIFDVFTDLLGMIMNMIGPLISAFKPFFDSFVSSIENLMPVFLGIGQVLTALAPIIEIIGKFVDMLTKAAAPIFAIVGGALKVVATVILGIVIMMNEIAAALGDTNARSEADRLKGMVDKMWAPGADELAMAEGHAAGAALRNADAQDEAAKSAQKVSEALSNVPSGYRIANARYQADLGISSGDGYMAGAGGGGGGVTINGNVNVTSSADTIGGVAADAKKEAARERGQRTGNPNGRPRGGGRDD